MSEFWTGQSGDYGNPHAGEPLQDQWLHDTDTTDQGADAWAELKPIPVKVEHSATENVAPQATALATYPIPVLPQVAGTGAIQALQVCPHRYWRYKAKFLFSCPGAGTIYVAKDPNTLMSNALGAAFAITIPVSNNPVPAQPAVPASGTIVQNSNNYPVNVTLAGFTATAVTVNGQQVGTGNGTYLVPAGGTIAITYTVQGTWVWANANTQPTVSSAALMPDYDGMQPLYMMATIAGCTVSVMDEGYNRVQ